MLRSEVSLQFLKIYLTKSNFKIITNIKRKKDREKGKNWQYVKTILFEKNAFFVKCFFKRWLEILVSRVTVIDRPGVAGAVLNSVVIN